MFKIRLKEIFRKPLKLEVFQDLTKLRDKIETAQDKQVAREKFEKAFLHTAKKLIKKQDPSRCYVFIKTFDDEYPCLLNIFNNVVFHELYSLAYIKGLSLSGINLTSVCLLVNVIIFQNYQTYQLRAQMEYSSTLHMVFQLYLF